MKIRVDLHVHSAASADGSCSLDTLCRQAKKRGLAAITVSDHDRCTPVSERNGLLLIPGVELGCEEGHLLGLFLQEPIRFESIAAQNGRFSLPSAVREIHRCGGIAVLAHPFAPQKLEPEELMKLPVDAIEAENSRAALKGNANLRARKLAEERGLPVCGGSDAHCRRELGGCCTLVEVESISAEAVKREILCGRSEAVLLRPSRWAYKGMSRLRRDWREKSAGGIIRALAYLCACIGRDLFGL